MTDQSASSRWDERMRIVKEGESYKRSMQVRGSPGRQSGSHEAMRETDGGLGGRTLTVILQETKGYSFVTGCRTREGQANRSAEEVEGKELLKLLPAVRGRGDREWAPSLEKIILEDRGVWELLIDEIHWLKSVRVFEVITPLFQGRELIGKMVEVLHVLALLCTEPKDIILLFMISRSRRAMARG